MNNKSYPANISKLKILTLSTPIFFANLAVPLVGIVDTGLMGNLGQTKFLAATSIATTVITMIVWSFGFLRMGTVGIVSQLYGRSDYREIVRTIIRNFLIAMVLAIIIVLLRAYVLDLIEYFFLISDETKILIKAYISVRVFSIPAEFIIYILVGFFFRYSKN